MAHGHTHFYTWSTPSMHLRGTVMRRPPPPEVIAGQYPLQTPPPNIYLQMRPQRPLPPASEGQRPPKTPPPNIYPQMRPQRPLPPPVGNYYPNPHYPRVPPPPQPYSGGPPLSQYHLRGAPPQHPGRTPLPPPLVGGRGMVGHRPLYSVGSGGRGVPPYGPAPLRRPSPAQETRPRYGDTDHAPPVAATTLANIWNNSISSWRLIIVANGVIYHIFQVLWHITRLYIQNKLVCRNVCLWKLHKYYIHTQHKK